MPLFLPLVFRSPILLSPFLLHTGSQLITWSMTSCHLLEAPISSSRCLSSQCRVLSATFATWALPAHFRNNKSEFSFLHCVSGYLDTLCFCFADPSRSPFPLSIHKKTNRRRESSGIGCRSCRVDASPIRLALANRFQVG
ncbi:hypothetical protein HDV57DRAFT_123371 [Trichoderma longibrachiatum]